MSKWRLRRTLSRRVEVRPIEQEDVRFAWAAYRKGKLTEMNFPEGLDAKAFKEAFEAYVLTRAHAAWTIITGTRDGFIPAGFVLGGWAPMEAYMVIIGISWLPWASKRNILEGTVAFFDKIRKQMGWMGFASPEHKRLYEVCCIHSIMRRVGTSNLSGHAVAVYEGKK